MKTKTKSVALLNSKGEQIGKLILGTGRSGVFLGDINEGRKILGKGWEFGAVK